MIFYCIFFFYNFSHVFTKFQKILYKSHFYKRQHSRIFFQKQKTIFTCFFEILEKKKQTNKQTNVNVVFYKDDFHLKILLKIIFLKDDFQLSPGDKTRLYQYKWKNNKNSLRKTIFIRKIVFPKDDFQSAYFSN
jgi:hypothetical protein